MCGSLTSVRKSGGSVCLVVELVSVRICGEICKMTYISQQQDGSFRVSGNTFPLRDSLKSLGGNWNAAGRYWKFQSDCELQKLIDLIKNPSVHHSMEREPPCKRWTHKPYVSQINEQACFQKYLIHCDCGKREICDHDCCQNVKFRPFDQGYICECKEHGRRYKYFE